MPLHDWITIGLASSDINMPWELPEPGPEVDPAVVAAAEEFNRKYSAMR